MGKDDKSPTNEELTENIHYLGALPHRSDAQQELLDLSIELLCIRQSNEAAEKEVLTIKEEIAAYDAEIEASKKRCEALEKETATIREITKKLRDEARALEKELSDLQVESISRYDRCIHSHDPQLIKESGCVHCGFSPN